MSRPLDDDDVELTDTTEFNEGFEAARTTLDGLLAGEPNPAGAAEGDVADDPAQRLQGIGQAADGRVVATVRVGGTLESIELDPRALRGGTELLGQQFAEAINAALDDLRTNAAQEIGGVDVDPLTVADDLTRVQDELAERAVLLAERFDDAMRQIARQAGGG
jgi:DNA-binding protein YbaB